MTAEMVLPLVVRLERAGPPALTDALQAAARAVLAMLTSQEPDWREAVDAWDSHRIRKVVRRARGADWRRALTLPGITVSENTAQVRVYPPIALDGWPPELSRLQVGGTELADPEPPAPPTDSLPLILLSPFVPMSAGKAMAQAGHAAQLGWRSLEALARTAWQDDGFRLAVRPGTDAQFLRYRDLGVPLVRDAGFTEVAPDSETALFVAGR